MTSQLAAKQTPPVQHEVVNRLLSLMTPADFALLAPHLAAIELPRGFVLAHPDQPIEHIYFIEQGVVSMVAVSPAGHEVEAGLVGPEGLASTAPLLGSDCTPNLINVQIPGNSWRIERTTLVAALETSPTLHNLLLRFLQTLIVQTTYTALTNAVHPIEERLARWLLMCDDRVPSGEIALTHGFMSVMLAVRRPSVTTALHILEGNGFVKANRACIIVRDRRRMEAFAADSYGKAEAAYQQLIGDMWARP